jgi:hypothetical protein
MSFPLGPARGLLLALGLLALPHPARAELPRVFVLPLRSNSWLDHDDRLLEARVGVALAQGHRVRPVAVREVGPLARGNLPADLAECTSLDCLRVLGQATGASRVLGLELFDEGSAPVLLATLYEPRTGQAVATRELPRATGRSSTRVWAEELARWVATVSTDVRPAPAPIARRPAGVLLSLELDRERDQPAEALALQAAMRERLTRRRQPRLAAPGEPAEAITHRGLITVESFGISERPHHVHRYRNGQLAAHWQVIDVRTGTVVFSKRASAELSVRARHTTDQQAADALTLEVAARLLDLDDAFDEALARGR